MLLISDGKDWTKNTPSVEYPYIQNVYKLYNKEGNVENIHLPEEGHDYGVSKRDGAFRFLARHLNLDIKAITNSAGKIDESFIKVEPREVLQAFDDKHQRPVYAVKGDREISLLLETFAH